MAWLYKVGVDTFKVLVRKANLFFDLFIVQFLVYLFHWNTIHYYPNQLLVAKSNSYLFDQHLT